MKSHYRGHKMAVWLNLIPQLHRPGDDDVSMRHHHFRERGDHYYAGTPVPRAREERKLDFALCPRLINWLSPLFRTGSRWMVHAAAADRHHSDRLLLDHRLQHVHGRREPHRGHHPDPGRLRGRRRAAAATRVPSLLQHDHRPRDHRGRRLHPPRAEHADLRGYLLPAGPRQEARRHGLPAERPGVPADDHQNVIREALREPATRSGAAPLLHHPREKPLHPGAAANGAGRSGLRAVEEGSAVR